MNSTRRPLAFERVVLPMPSLALYADPDHRLWTDDVTYELSADPEGTVRTAPPGSHPRMSPRARPARAAPSAAPGRPSSGERMNDLIQSAWAWLNSPTADRYWQSALILVSGIFITRWITRAAGALVERHRGANSAMITRRLLTYGLYSLVVLSVLQHLGFKLSVLLGAAGVLTVAVGFAAQTSASNLIAGCS
ncbi:MAG: mechanosensitive ion channel [Myxococcales bacterium]|nr:mechanosensitive ion channel [Myxococcales bacterium]